MTLLPKQVSTPFHYLKITAPGTSIFYFLYIAFLGTGSVFFLAVCTPLNDVLFGSIQTATAVFCFSLLFLYGLWYFLACSLKTSSPNPFASSSVILSPLVLLILVTPYGYLPVSFDSHAYIWILSALIVCHVCFYFILKLKNIKIPESQALALMAVFVVLYWVSFSVIAVKQYHHFAHFNPSDLALYNQIQWNNLHGRFFASSVSGSNFATHNSPFLLLLTPLYALWPHPETLLVLKTVFLGLSVIPFYLIVKTVLGREYTLPLSGAFLLYPFLAAQNFAAPHEICFAPFFLLFLFYFFSIEKFKPFIVFLVLCLSIKEHIALIAVLFGFFAWRKKRNLRWILWPWILGFGWGLLSLAIIVHYQHIYRLDPHPAWMLKNLQQLLIQSPPESLATAYQGAAFTAGLLYQLVSPLGLFVPFFSAVALLGMPELLLNLLSGRLVFFPIWHYNIAVSCFLWAGIPFAVKKFSSLKYFKTMDISLRQSQMLVSVFIFLCIFAHSFLWMDFAKITSNPSFKKAISEIVSLIPSDASVTTTNEIAPYVSSRKDYYLINDTRKGGFILTKMSDVPIWASQYEQVADIGGLALFKNKKR